MVIKMTNPTFNKRVLDANIEVHSALANAGEYNKSPHFLPENREKVRNKLSALFNSKPITADQGSKLLDLGCGTGFIIDLAKDIVDEIHGVDITEDMMRQVDISSGNITLQKAQAEHTPYEDDCFDFVTAYSFLDHLVSYEAVLKEAFRVLVPGGIFFAGLNPNKYFALHLNEISSADGRIDNPIVAREITSMLDNGSYYEETFGIDAQTLLDAEPVKSFDRGIDPHELCAIAGEIGFSRADYSFEWFLGQGVVMHQHSFKMSEAVNEYLKLIGPAGKQLFKYVDFVLIK